MKKIPYLSTWTSLALSACMVVGALLSVSPVSPVAHVKADCSWIVTIAPENGCPEGTIALDSTNMWCGSFGDCSGGDGGNNGGGGTGGGTGGGSCSPDLTSCTNVCGLGTDNCGNPCPGNSCVSGCADANKPGLCGNPSTPPTCGANETLVNNQCVPRTLCQDSVTTNVGCPSGYTGSHTQTTSYYPAPACTSHVVDENTCTAPVEQPPVTCPVPTFESLGCPSGYTGVHTLTTTYSGVSCSASTAELNTCTPPSNNNPPASFSYTMSAASPVTEGSAGSVVPATVNKTLNTGSTQPVDVSVSTISGDTTGITYSYGSRSCSPTCSTVIYFTLASNAVVGDHTVTVTGTSTGTSNQTTSFTLRVDPSSAVSVTCAVSPKPVLVGNNVTWTGMVIGATGSTTYTWIGEGLPADARIHSLSFGMAYSTVGHKTAQLSVTDSHGTTACTPADLQVNFNPKYQEF